MASFLTELVKSCVVKFINGTITESSYVCCFTRIAKDFEDERARLEVESTIFKRRLDVARRKGEDVEANALFWVYEAEQFIQEDTKTKQKCLFGFCCHCIWRYKRGKELANKKEQIKILMETGKKFKETENEQIKTENELAIALPARLPHIERYSSQCYIPFESRKFKYIELLDAMNDDNNYIVGLLGLGGIGKTTLAKEVGKELKGSNQFTHVIETTVSFSPDIKKIQDDIAGPLGLKFDDCNEPDRPKKLLTRLTNGEKILLILYDVWKDIDFKEIGIPYNDNHKGCRILVTTRSVLVCKKLGCSTSVKLDLLSYEDAWIMFKRYAGLSEILTKNLLDKGRKITYECNRLPIAIAVIASRLKGVQRREEWDEALTSLQSMHDFGDEMVTVPRCVKFSYDHLMDEKGKGLFLLCSVFRENEEIPIESLTRFCTGAGIFGEVYERYQDARNNAVIAKNKLLDSCLLLEAGQSGVKMHNLVRDAAQWLANKQIQTINLYDKNQKAVVEREKNIMYLLLQGKLKDVFSCKHDGSKLEILIGIIDKDEDYHNMKVPDSFFDNNTSLRVFYLFYDHYPILALSLPQSIQSLKNIRSLLFTLVDLGNISILGNLQSLETLDLKDCKIDELPHGITKLEKFRLLNLEGCEIERNNPFEVIKECSSLEELYFTGCFNASCQEITFPELQRFCIDEFSRFVNDSSSKYVSVLDKDDVFLSETTLKYCMQTAEVLRLRRIERGWRNLIPEIVSMDQGMNDMVELSLSCISQLQYLIDTKHVDSQVPHVFSKLVVLKLDRMENLKELFNGPISLDCLNNLEKLSIKDCKHLRSLSKCTLNLCNLKTIELQSCPMLVSLYQLLTSRNLVVLETLKISHCKRLENIIADERREEESREDIDGGNNIKCFDSMFPELKVLDIEGCPLLESIFPFLVVQDLPVLQTIKIRRCDGLKYIFGQYQHEEFSSLKQLELCQLPNFIDMFCKSNHPISLSEKGSSSTSKAQLQLDPMKCNIFSWDTTTFAGIPLVGGHYSEYFLNIWERTQCLQIPSKILCNIKKIELSRFSMLKSVFIPSIASTMLLETLTIRNCDKLMNIIDFGDYDSDRNNWGNVFPKMKELYIEDCPKMEYIFGHYTDDHQNNVEIQLQLLELKCLSLYNLPNLVAMCPKHYRIRFPLLAKLELNKCSEAANKSMSHFKKEDGDGQTAITESVVTTQHINGKNQQKTSKINDDQDSQNDNAVMKVSLNVEVQFPKGFPNRTEVQATSKGKQELVVNVSGIEITSVANLPTNSKALLNDKKYLVDQQRQLGEIGTAATSSRERGDGQIATETDHGENALNMSVIHRHRFGTSNIVLL